MAGLVCENALLLMSVWIFRGASATLLAAGLLAVFATRAPAADPAPAFALKSVKVELPESDMTFPDGPGVEAVTGNCLTCHSAGMVLRQPALSKTAWEAEVHKMISVYKASIAEDDVPAIVGYLAATKGAN